MKETKPVRKGLPARILTILSHPYARASVVMTGMACLMMIAGTVVHQYTPLRSPLFDWTSAVQQLIAPVFCLWLGGLLRTAWAKPPKWLRITLAALIPAMYAVLVACPALEGARGSWPNGYDMLLFSLIILGFLILPEAKAGTGKGWLALVMFLGAAFVFVGVTRVADHFGAGSLALWESQWTKLFTRSIRVVPLAMSLFFLLRFSLSEIGQKIGGIPWLRWLTLALILFSGLALYIYGVHYAIWHRTLLVHPLTVFLLWALWAGIRRLALLTSKKPV